MKDSNKQVILSDEQLKKLQNVELELLIEFDRICRKHNIIYSIYGGTLLGAVRHKGFIPWDDDADVAISRAEYNKFLAVIDKELDPNEYYYHNMNLTKGYRWGYGKLRRKNTEFVRINQEYMPYEQGIFMDVFVFDNVPDNYILRAICNFQAFLYRKALYSRVGVHTTTGKSRLAFKVLNLIPEESLKKSYNRFVKRRNRKHTNWVKCLTWPAYNKAYGSERYWLEDTIDIDFEGHMLKACREYDRFLTFKYGDYMTLPPVSERKVHPVSKISFNE